MSNINDSEQHWFLSKNGEISKCIQNRDWSDTPLGAPEAWLNELKTNVALILNQPVAMCLLWGQDFIQIYNHEFARAFKLSDHCSLLGAEAISSLPAIWKPLQSALSKAINGEPSLVRNVSYQHLLNARVSFSFGPVILQNQETGGILVTVTNMTAVDTDPAPKADKEVKGLELFKFMVDSAVDSFVLIDEDGQFSYMNNMALLRYGYNEAEIRNLKLKDLLPDFNQEFFTKMFWKAQKEIIRPFEALLLNKQGDTFPIEVNMGGLIVEGRPCLFAIVRDISARKKTEEELLIAFRKVEESEKKFRNTVEKAPMGIMIATGSDFYVEQANESFLEIVQKSADEFIGQPIFDNLPELTPLIKPILDGVVRTGERFFGNEFEVTFGRGSKPKTGWFNFVYEPLRKEDGETYGIIAVATEVTDLVTAKLKLQESEKHLRNLIKHSPIPMTILRGETFIIDTANRVMLEKIWKKEESEVLGRPLLEVFPFLESQRFAGLLKETFQSGAVYQENETPLIFDEDSAKPFYLDFENAPLLDAEGNVYALIVTAMDVTDKVDARKKAEDAAERLQLATEATGTAVWDLNLRTGEIIYSPRLLEIFGHSPNSIFTHQQLRSQLHPHDQFLVEKAFQFAMENGRYEYEARIVRPDNKIIWLRTQGKIFFDENHQPVKMLGTVSDISEAKHHQQILQKSESRFRSLANSLPQHVWTADSEGNIFYFNNTLTKFTGLKQEELENQNWIKVIHPDEQEETMAAWKNAVSNGVDFLIEHRFRKYDGEYRWQLSQAVPQRDASGEIQMWVGSSTDIQEMKEQELQKDYFISMASHELKTPLTSIKGYVQILQTMQPKIEETFLNKSLKTVDKQINKLTELIGELLDVSKIKSGGLEYNKEYFKMCTLVKEVVTEISHINPAHNISLSPQTNAFVYADRNRIGQVLINLLNNAVKYAPNSFHIHVNCHQTAETVQIEIRDEGIGIQKAHQEKIFHRFYRVEGRDEKTFPGFGIGLFISSEIIKKHGGTIRVNSDVGKGSTFIIELPLVEHLQK